MIKAVIFDLGGVLIDNPAPGIIDYCAAATHLKKDIFSKALENHLNDFQLSKITEHILWQKIIAKNPDGKVPNHPIWLAGLKRVYHEKTEVFDLIKSLKEKHIHTALLSNTEPPIQQYIDSLPQYAILDVRFYSSELKLLKPNPEIYRYALHELHVKPEETIFIDDRTVNVQGAQNVGIHGITFTSPKNLLQQLTAFRV